MHSTSRIKIEKVRRDNKGKFEKLIVQNSLQKKIWIEILGFHICKEKLICLENAVRCNASTKMNVAC